MKYRREIDGLRALAVLSVILFHAEFKLFSGGFVGVDIFFVISGFLITSIIIGDLESSTFSVASFYERRARRIFPALALVIACSIPLARIWMLPSEFNDFCRSILSVATFSSNYYFRSTTDYFAAAAEEKPLLHTWSLAVEEQYYFVFPLVLVLLWRLRRNMIAVTLFALAVTSLLFAEWHIDEGPEYLFFDTRGRVWELLAGALLALHSHKRDRANSADLTSQALGLFGLGLVLYALFFFDKAVTFPSVYTLIPTVGTVLILRYGTSESIVGKIFGSRPLVAIGLISYSAYLWHQPLFAFARLRSADEPSALLFGALSALTLLLAYVTWRFVETPFRNRQFISRRGIVGFTTSTACCMAIFGILGGPFDLFPVKPPEGTVPSLVLNQLSAERKEITRNGECQFNKHLENYSIDEFLRDWRCDVDPKRPDLKKIPVIVVGDSHSADIVAALKTNGYLPVQMGGPGCSVTPKTMSKPCRKQFAFIKEWAMKRPYYTHIVLANRWEEKELSQANLEAMLRYWSLPGRTIVFFTSRPEFPRYQNAVQMGRATAPNFDRASLSSAPWVVQLLSDKGVEVVNSQKLFCSLTSDCGWRTAQGDLLTTDGHHLSRRGAELFGQKLIELGNIPLK